MAENNFKKYDENIKNILEKYGFQKIATDKQIGGYSVDFYAENQETKKKIFINIVKGAYTGSVMKMKSAKSRNLFGAFRKQQYEYILFSPYFPDSENAVNIAKKNNICIYENEQELEKAIIEYSKK